VQNVKLVYLIPKNHAERANLLLFLLLFVVFFEVYAYYNKKGERDTTRKRKKKFIKAKKFNLFLFAITATSYQDTLELQLPGHVERLLMTNQIREF